MNNTWIIEKIFNVGGRYAICGIAVDNNGNIYFTKGTEGLYQINKDDTKPQCILKNESAMMGIIWNRNNILYICDYDNHRILSYSIDTRNLSILSGNGKEGNKDGNMKEAQFNYPRGITMDKNGDLYITDIHHVRKINLSKETVETIAGSGDTVPIWKS